MNHPVTRTAACCCVVVGVCFYAALTVSATELKLSISGGQPLLLTWSTNIPSFALEIKPDMNPDVPFQVYPPKPGIIGTNFVLTNVSPVPSRMYRLSNWPQKTCMNQMKQIGLAFAFWALDNGDRFPFHVSTNLGGTREFRAIGPDGFDTNAWRHFIVLSNDVNAANLVCRGDVWRTAVTNFSDLTPTNVTYRLRTDDSVMNGYPGIVLFVCPIDGNTGYCDGAVAQGTNFLK